MRVRSLTTVQLYIVLLQKKLSSTKSFEALLETVTSGLTGGAPNYMYSFLSSIPMVIYTESDSIGANSVYILEQGINMNCAIDKYLFFKI